MMMNAMYWHNLIEVVLELAGITACVIAFLAVAITGYLYYTEGPGSIPDEVWDLYTKGGKYNYQHMGTSGQNGAPRARIDVPAYRNGDTEYDKDKGVVMPPEPEDDEEETTVATDFPEDENTEAPMIEFSIPDYDVLKAQPTPKTLKAKSLPPW